MEKEYKQWQDKFREEKEYWSKQFANWKKKKPKDLDSKFHDNHSKVFSKVDCLKCANCCKTTSPIFRDIDIKRISKALKTNEKTFIQNYLRLDEDADYVLKSSPCSFLNEDNTCLIYEIRPLACREYPHTDRKNMIQILDLTFLNAEVCPAVSKILDNLK